MRATFFIIGSFILFNTFGCSVSETQNTHIADQNEEESIPPSAYDYTVGATRIEAPPVVSAYEPFEIRVWAHLGPNSCYRFSRFEVDWRRNEVYVKIYARKFQKENEACLAHPSELRGKALLIDPPDIYEEIIIISRAYEGSENIERVVAVKR